MSDSAAEISRLERSDTLGLAFLRTVILLNSGAILALLTFLGNADAQANVSIPLNTIKSSMGAFLIGIVAVLLALIGSYAYTASAPETSWSQWWDTYVIRINSALAITSVLAFALGIVFILYGATEI